MKKEYLALWYTKGGALCRIFVRETTQQRPKRLGPITIYRDRFGVTYSSRYVKAWRDLTEEQKIAAYRASYINQREDAIWRVQKDPGLESQYQGWIASLKKERDEGISAILRGEDAPEPKPDGEEGVLQ